MISDTIGVSDKSTLIKIAVNDANLFIDLYDINLLDSFFELPLTFHTTQLILNELEKEQLEVIEKFINSNRLIVRHLTFEEINSLSNLSTNSRKLSREDLSVYYYAKELGECLILTGDNRLRKEAQRQGFEVHGILWVLEQLVETNILSSVESRNSLQNLMSINLWLPVNECEKLVEKWKN